MNLDCLLDGVAVVRREGRGNPEITEISIDSRRARRGSLFCCFQGLRADSHNYALEAAGNGAAAFLCERTLTDIPKNIPQIIVKDARAAMALCSGAFFDNPARGLTLIGVTGTNGKTTTTHMIKAIGEAWGKRVGLIGTNYILIDKLMIEAHATTPDPFELHSLFRRMADAGMQWVVMEVSAHALWLRKLCGLVFDVGVFTNFSQDHLNDFGTMEAYFEAKARLFKPDACKSAVLFLDDPQIGGLKTSVSHTSFGFEEGADVRAVEVRQSPGGSGFRLETAQGSADIKVAIPGYFTALNAAAAGGAALALGIPLPVIRCGLERMPGVPGRMETVPSKDGATYIVDYACTPDALVNALKAARGFTSGRLCVVFGCGGDRDAAKRPLMGCVASELADMCIVTSDNPRTEDPERIIDAIVAGMKGPAEIRREPDRAAALKAAVEWAGEGDVVLVEGKGNENYQDIGGVKLPFSDREVLERLIH
ncbi:MAG: UDP-N-acetylmuramoyl-L-alanyl-D-glutamate--2,6-diaminopimelate ligase [Clostridia bacterium]|nr:UDP-N-acetylmuramoyl-L-alanyl-D-glutamate--2,6-diaminopimelate ligase [Clostridia bacterium]